MANIKITDLTAYTDPLNTDVLPIVDVTSDTTKKVSIADLLENAGSGTAAAPGIAFDGDSNTGIYRPGADQVAVATNGSARLYITSDGKVGIGTTSPSELLSLSQDVATEANLLSLTGTSFADGEKIFATFKRGSVHLAKIGVEAAGAGQAGELVFETASSGTALERVRIDSSGRVGIGSSAPVSELHVESATQAALTVKGGLNMAKFASKASDVYIAASSGGSNIIFKKAVPVVAHPADSGTETVRIDSSGRLLVGTSSAPTAATTLVLKGNSASTNTQGRIHIQRAAVPGDGDFLGDVNFMDTSNGIAGAIGVARDGGTWTAGSSTPGRLVFSTTADGASSPTERMRISANGKVSIGRGTTNLASFTTGAYLKLSTGADTTTGDFSCESYAGNAGTRYHFGFSNTNGLVGSITTNSSTTAYNTSSDYRLKENVVPLTGAADRVNQLQVHRFNFIADPDTTVDGFIAHEAQAVVQEAVTGTHDEVDDDGNPVYQGIDQSKLVPLLTAALQEALAKIETLEQRLNDAGIA